MKPSIKLILGSQSPRRKDLLSQAGFEFEIRKSDFDETFPDNLPTKDVAEYIAVEKNKTLRSDNHSDVILTADTIVVSNGMILGKPVDGDEASTMLNDLSGATHAVITGVCISNAEKTVSFSVNTEVKVKKLSKSEIAHYITKFKPYDKAGAYGIQEWFGLIAVESIQGSFFNVVGLPIHEVFEVLVNEFNIQAY